jgi:hypothetical protein
VHNGNDVDITAADGDTIDDSKYTVSKNPPITPTYINQLQIEHLNHY